MNELAKAANASLPKTKNWEISIALIVKDSNVWDSDILKINRTRLQLLASKGSTP